MSRRSGRHAGYVLLGRELRARRDALLSIGLWSVVEALPVLLSGLVVAAAMDRFLARDVAGGLAVLALLLAAAAVGAVATSRLFTRLAAVVEPVRDGFITAVVEGAVTEATAADHRLDTAGVARLTGQVQAVRNMLFGLLRSVRQTAFTFVAALVGLALLAPVAALAAAVFIGLALALLALVIPGLAARHRAVLLAEEEVARRAGTVFGGVRDAIACAGEDQAVREVGRAVDDQVALARALARVTALRSLVVFVGGQAPLLVLLAAAPWLLRSGSLSVSEMVGAATYLTASLEPALRSIVDVVGGWGLDLAVTLRRLGEGFTRPDPGAPAPAPAGVPAPAPAGHDLAVRGLTFAYGPHAKPVVRDLDFTVPAGGHVAIVGSSGIGKSTLANLLAGLLAPQHGTVLLGGRAVGQIPAADLRRAVGLIPQEAYVHAGTLRENLTYLSPDATAAQLDRAVAAVGAGPLVERLGGLDASVGAGGAELSQGERQLVALARVYLSPALVVILDEATANLDPAAEARAEAAFADRPGTLVVIAHRISSARRADQILLLDGERVYLGSNDELARTSSRYADLVGHWDEADHPVSLPV